MSLYLAVAILPAIAALGSGSMAIYAWQRRETNGARAFSLCTASVFIWCFFAVFEQLSPHEFARVMFGRVQYVGISFFGLFWLIFTLRYAHCDGWLTRKSIVKLAVVPAMTMCLALTDVWHGLMWQSAKLIQDPFPHLEIDYGWWFYYVWMPYGYVLLIAGFGVLLYGAFAGSGLYRKQTVILISAALITFVCNVLYIISGVTIFGLDPTPVGFGLGAMLCHIGLFNARFLDIAPISYKTVFLNTVDAVILVDSYRRIVDLNPSALLESGLAISAKTALGKPFGQIFPLYGELLAGTDSRVPLNEIVQLPGQLPERRTSGAVRHAFREVKVRSLQSPGGRSVGQVVIIRDISLEKQQQFQLEQFAYVDGLTGVFNRRQLEISARQFFHAEPVRGAGALSMADSAVAIPSQSVALLYLDLNRFKPINDTYGHDVGDAVLQYFAQCLERSVRKGDVVARLGGDEFAALLHDADGTVAQEVRSRITHTLGQSVIVAGHRIHLSVSIGVAYYPEEGQDLKTLLRQADMKMYGEKRLTKRRWPEAAGESPPPLR